MKNLLDAGTREALLARAARLTPESPRRWGRMDVGQMACHITDPMRIALGELPAQDASNLLTRSALKWLVLVGMPAPKGKVRTFPELDQVQGGGTRPAGLAADLAALRSTVERFLARAASGESMAPSPGFGRLGARAYGRLMYVHMHHHLKQFGV